MIDNVKHKYILIFSLITFFLTGGISQGFAGKTSDMAISEHKMKHEHHNDQAGHHDGHENHNIKHEGGHEDHSAHRAAINAKYANKKYTRSEVNYDVNSIDLLRMDEKLVSLSDEIKGDGPVLLNFIFTSCATICPVLTSTFSDFQKKLGEEARNVTMISISIDPQYDTAEKLRDYARRFGAGPQWKFYTGSDEQSINAQKAFDAYRGGKMNHIPLTFLRPAAGEKWIRLEGFTSSSQLLGEYRDLTRS